MLYTILKRRIQRGYTDGMGEKLDIFFAADKITTDEYRELVELLNSNISV